MTEIDYLRRIQIRDLKPYFAGLAKARAQLLELFERKPEKIRKTLEEVNKSLQGTLTFSDSTTYSVQARVNEYVEIESFLFKWEDDGEQREQRISVTSRPSNLVEGASCYYFLCPYTSRICRKLYTDGRVLVSRYGFPHTYSQRNYSHRWRADKKVLDFMLFVDEEENFKRKRERYNGKLTRFGRKLVKIMGGETYEEIRKKQRGGILNLLQPYRKGRPPKPSSPPPLFMK